MAKSPVLTVTLSRIVADLDERRDWRGMTPVECGDLAGQLGALLDGAIALERFLKVSASAVAEAQGNCAHRTPRRHVGNVVEFPAGPENGGAA